MPLPQLLPFTHKVIKKEGKRNDIKREREEPSARATLPSELEASGAVGVPGASRGSDAGKQRAVWPPAGSIYSLQLRVKPEDKPEVVRGGASFSVITSSVTGVPLDTPQDLSESYFPILKNEGGDWNF